jgi:hypothetical protein
LHPGKDYHFWKYWGEFPFLGIHTFYRELIISLYI